MDNELEVTPAHNNKIAILTVHGTGDGSLGSIGEPKWWEQNSAFLKDVDARLGSVDVETVHHYASWDEQNSERSRRRAAKILARQIRDLSRQGLPVHVIAHSHGGNIAEEAVYDVDRRRKTKAVHSITTVGTPFFRRRFDLKRSVKGLFYLLCCLATLLVSVVMVFKHDIELSDSLDRLRLALGALTIVSSFATMWLLYDGSIKGLLNFPTRNPIKARWRTIMHDGDEVMATLSADQSLFRISRKGTLARLSRWTFDKVVLLSLVFTVGYVVSEPIRKEEILYYFGMPLPYLIWIAFPLLFGLALAITAVGEGPIRNIIDRRFYASIRNAAYGADTEQVLHSVDTAPSLFKSEDVDISSETSHKMQQDAVENLALFITENHTTFFELRSRFDVEQIYRTLDQGQLWDSLIHCRYFEYPEIAQLVAENIVSHLWNGEGELSRSEVQKHRIEAIDRMRRSRVQSEAREKMKADPGIL